MRMVNLALTPGYPKPDTNSHAVKDLLVTSPAIAKDQLAVLAIADHEFADICFQIGHVSIRMKSAGGRPHRGWSASNPSPSKKGRTTTNPGVRVQELGSTATQTLTGRLEFGLNPKPKLSPSVQARVGVQVKHKPLRFEKPLIFALGSQNVKEKRQINAVLCCNDCHR